MILIDSIGHFIYFVIPKNVYKKVSDFSLARVSFLPFAFISNLRHRDTLALILVHVLVFSCIINTVRKLVRRSADHFQLKMQVKESHKQ